MDMEKTISFSALASLPREDAEAAEAQLRSALASVNTKLLVLDDDPTGVQTVHDVPVYTDWSYESILSGFREPGRLFFVLTNSRGFTAEQTERVHRDIAAAAYRAASEAGVDYMLVSRGDSTLRGHFPLETETLREETERLSGRAVDGEMICPFFLEGGRYTLGNVHYVRSGEELVPAAQTEFARDATFGYSHSDLPGYIEEKTGGRCRAEDTLCISVEELRTGGAADAAERLCSLSNFRKAVINAVSYADAKVAAAAIWLAAARGKRFILRTAASLVKELGGVSSRPLLTHAELTCGTGPNGGVVVVGSHTAKTTRQLEELKKLECVECVEFNSDLVLSGSLDGEVRRVTAELERIIQSGKTAVAYTKRSVLSLPDDTAESALLRSVAISDAVQSLVADLGVTPSFIVAKGGITSSDVGTKALRVRRAVVMGQIRPGVPVWRTGPESRFPGIPYVIFPGNVGEDSTLREAVEVLTRE